MERDMEVPLAGKTDIQDEHHWELESSASPRTSNDSSATLLFHGSSFEHEDEHVKDSDTLCEHGDGIRDDAPGQQGIIDPRLKDYPIPLVAQTVHLHNNDTSVF